MNGPGDNARAEAPLRIAGVDPERGFAGGETQVLGLTLALLRAGHQAELICDPDGELWRRARAAGVRCHPLRIRNSVDLAAGVRIRRLLRINRFDVTHFHTARAHALAPWARGRARTLVVTRRMDYPPNRIFARWLFDRAVDGVAAISPAVAAALARAGVARERVTLIPSGVDCAHFRPPTDDERRAARTRFGLADDEFAIGAIGALAERKGQRFLIEAIARIREGAADGAPDAGGRARATRCLIAGAGAIGAALAAEIERRGVGGAVRMVGPITDARDLLRALDLFVMPSIHEGLGVAALEAMACGVPVIASRTGGLIDLIGEGGAGILTPPGDSAALAEAIASLARSPARRAEIGAAGRARVATNFTMAAMAARTVALYREAIRRRGARGN